jgi:putative pyruvate formate lyase activating enzyme
LLLECLHYAEEEELIPSHTVFFVGCNWKCHFCGTEEGLKMKNGYQITPAFLARAMERRAREGARNVNFVGGEPSVHLPVILQALRQTRASLGVVLNSNGFLSEKAMQLCRQVVDLYLFDLRFGPGDCDRRLGAVPGSWAVVTRNLLQASQQGEVWVRHLQLPGHLDCCTQPALRWLAAPGPGEPDGQLLSCFSGSALPRALWPPGRLS